MYPLTDYPDSLIQFGAFAELREHVENLPEDLNQILSWDFSGDDAGPADWFALLIHSPRKNKAHQLDTPFDHVEDRARIDAWIRDYVKPRTDRWYGWRKEDHSAISPSNFTTWPGISFRPLDVTEAPAPTRSPADVIADQQTYHMAELQMYRRARRLDERILEALDEAGWAIVPKHEGKH
ncbi:hypothetical protein ACH47B_06450 [Rhodococcus sp. NPDC019627]|uniref:hypothetical protein n=1 Tax=unclassified Rhodococcus (in: high G+C Gram-positive bacteria) TaxID=192944 RepID=UPI0037A4069E